jgi:UDP-glucose 4,6-dehydratase
VTAPPPRRYYICDNKLAALGWVERTSWEEGLRRTVDWYLKHGFASYWDNGSVEAALQPHPVLRATGGGEMPPLPPQG